MMKRNRLALGMALALSLGLLGGCTLGQTEPTPSAPPVETPAPSPTPGADRPAVRLAVLNGPSGVGAAKLMADSEADLTENDYTITLAGANDQVTAGLVSGELDAAAVATNVAAMLYHKTDGQVQIAAATGLGVLYLLENGDSVHSVGDLERKTVWATGQGANPQYILSHLLAKNGVEPRDVDFQWATPEEISAKMASGEAKLCMLPVPAATAVLMKNPDVRQAVDLSAEWDALESGSHLTQTVLVVRRDFAQANPQAVETLLEEYGASVEYMADPMSLAVSSNLNPAQLVAHYGLAPSAAVAGAAIPQCNLVFITGAEQIREAVQGFFEVLWQADPASVGGSVPDDGIYYGG